MRRRYEFTTILAVVGYLLSISILLLGLHIYPLCNWYLDNRDCSKREFFELLYFLTGGPLLFLAAVAGLRQLQLGKESLRLTKEATEQMRELEAKKFAADVARNFNSDLSRVSTIAEERVEAIKDRLLYKVRMDGVEAIVYWSGPVTERLCLDSDQYKQLLVHMHHVINELDIFAGMVKVYPEQEENLYDLCAGIFLQSALWCMPALVTTLTQDYCPNLLSLLKRWGGIRFTGGRSTQLRQHLKVNEKFVKTCQSAVKFIDTWGSPPGFSRPSGRTTNQQ